jgi:hypothetical protein
VIGSTKCTSLNLNARDVPSRVDLDGNDTMADNTIHVSGLRVGIGHSNIEASGKPKDPAKNGSRQFNVELALGELGRLAGVSVRPEGTVELHETAQLDRSNNYDVVGNLQAKDASVRRKSSTSCHTARSRKSPLTPLDGQRCPLAPYMPSRPGQLTNAHSFREQQRIQGWNAQAGASPWTDPLASNTCRRRGSPALFANSPYSGAEALTKSGREFESKCLAPQERP